MSLNLHIKVIVFLFFGLIGFGQNNNAKNKTIFFDDSRQRIGSIAYSFQKPIETGDNFIGQAFDGDNGYNFRAQLFLYKQFFIGYTLSGSNFDVIDTTVVGNYLSSKARERFFYLGYEFLPLKRMRFGVYTSLGGKVTFENSVENTPDNKDTGKLWSYGVYIDFQVIKNLSLFTDYSFRSVNTYIESPILLQSVFDKGTYNTINFGIKFSFGDKDLSKIIGIEN